MRCAARPISVRAAVAVFASMRWAFAARLTEPSAAFSSGISEVAGAAPARSSAATPTRSVSGPLTLVTTTECPIG